MANGLAKGNLPTSMACAVPRSFSFFPIRTIPPKRRRWNAKLPASQGICLPEPSLSCLRLWPSAPMSEERYATICVGKADRRFREASIDENVVLCCRLGGRAGCSGCWSNGVPACSLQCRGHRWCRHYPGTADWQARRCEGGREGGG